MKRGAELCTTGTATGLERSLVARRKPATNDNRQTTSVEDLLSAPVEKRHYPVKCCATYAERLLQTINQDIMIDAV